MLAYLMSRKNATNVSSKNSNFQSLNVHSFSIIHTSRAKTYRWKALDYAPDASLDVGQASSFSS